MDGEKQLNLTSKRWVMICAAFPVVASLAGCDDPFAVEQISPSKECRESFNDTAMRDWVQRVERGTNAGAISLTYSVKLPYNNAKQLENALAQLPGESQQLKFDGNGVTNVVVSGMRVPIEVSVSGDTDGNSTTTERILIMTRLCGAVRAVDGMLTDVSVHTTGYSFDDGKLYPVPVS